MCRILHKITIQRQTRCHNHLIATFESFYQLVFAIMPPPHDNRLFGRNFRIDDFIPTNHDFPFRSDYISNTTDKIMFQSSLIDQLFFLDETLDIGILKPALIAIMHLIASNMDIGRGKQSYDFIQHITDKFKRFFLAGMECKSVPTSFTTARKLRIGTACRSGMTWHIEFWHDHNLAFSCISDHLFNFLLCIKSRDRFRIMPIADSTNGCQFGITLDLNTPSRLIRQMPMKDIQT